MREVTYYRIVKIKSTGNYRIEASCSILGPRLIRGHKFCFWKIEDAEHVASQYLKYTKRTDTTPTGFNNTVVAEE